jgi:hypothetical protein
MGLSLNVGYQVELETGGHGTGYGGDHPDLGNNLHRLDGLLERVGLVRLDSFLSVEPSEAAGWLGVEPDDPSVPPEQWFNPTDGLKAVQAARELVDSNPQALFGVREGVLDDLQDVENELTVCEAEQRVFHFSLLD